MKILLHTNALNERGTTVAIRDYAHGLSMRGIKVSIAYCSEDETNVSDVECQMRNEFEIYGYSDFQSFTRQNSRVWDLAYFMKYGYNDGKLMPNIPNIVHAVFQSYDPHGEAYLYISEWLARKMRIKNLKNIAKLSRKGLNSLKGKNFNYLPHIVDLPLSAKNMRAIWQIPEDALVGGRHGAMNTFDVPMVHRTVHQLLSEYTNLYFVFANTNRFINHPRVKFLPKLMSRIETREYLSSLDFYIHARHRGETFGLSLLEAMLCKIPVFSFSGGVDGNHRHLLKNSQNSLFHTAEQLSNGIRDLSDYGDVESNFQIASVFSPDSVMEQWSTLLTELMSTH